MSMTNGAEPDEIGLGMARLEAALDRIAALSAAPSPAPAHAAEPEVDQGRAAATAAAVARLDDLIARLRAAVGET